MNFCEVSLHNTESVYLLAPTKYRAVELVGDCFAVAVYPNMVHVRQHGSASDRSVSGSRALPQAKIHFDGYRG